MIRNAEGAEIAEGRLEKAAAILNSVFSALSAFLKQIGRAAEVLRAGFHREFGDNHQ